MGCTPLPDFSGSTSLGEEHSGPKCASQITFGQCTLQVFTSHYSKTLQKVLNFLKQQRCFVLEQCMYLVLSTVIFAGPFQISSPEQEDLLWSTPLEDPLSAASAMCVLFFFKKLL